MQKRNNKKFTKYIPAFDYFDKKLLILRAASGDVSIYAFATVFGAPIGIESTNLSLVECFLLIIELQINFESNEKKENRTIKLFY